MTTDRDVSAIASWERAEHAPNPGGHAQPYVCTGCKWTGRGETALRHYRDTGHAIRGRNWPAGWPNVQFSVPPTVQRDIDAFVSVCAWCSDSQERTAALKRQGRTVTHGICPTCKENFEARR